MTDRESLGPFELVLTLPAERDVRVERIFRATPERLWRALTEPELVAQWWGRGNRLDIEHMEVEPGGRWRFVEHAPGGVEGFEGRYLEVTPPRRIVQTFAWDGMPEHVVKETLTLEDLGDGRTRLITLAVFRSRDERNGMLASGMEDGMAQSYRVLDAVLSGLA
ncbi:MAG: SRPBCC family protein [Deinococcales bacterium]